jgi:hypothetical protein
MGFGGRVLGTALLIGAGAAAIGAVVAAPGILRALRPVVRESLRRGFGLYERARSAAAEFVDDIEDLVAEVRADVSGEQPPTPEAKPKDLK